MRLELLLIYFATAVLAIPPPIHCVFDKQGRCHPVYGSGIGDDHKEAAVEVIEAMEAE